MKKLTLAITLILALCLCSCSGGNDKTTENGTQTKETEEVQVVKKAVLIGGGANEALNKQIVDLCGKDNPKVTVFATAMSDDSTWIANAVSYFTPYSTDVKSILLINPNMSDDEIKARVLESDIVYVTGGTTETLMRKWEQHGVDDTLTEAYNNGTVVCGSSAGGICWSYAGFNDFDDGTYRFINGIDAVNIWFGPHYEGTSEAAWGTFDKVLTSKTESELEGAPTVGYAMSPGAALICRDGDIEIFKSSDADHVFKFEFKDGAWSRTEAN